MFLRGLDLMVSKTSLLCYDQMHYKPIFYQVLHLNQRNTHWDEKPKSYFYHNSICKLGNIRISKYPSQGIFAYLLIFKLSN